MFTFLFHFVFYLHHFNIISPHLLFVCINSIVSFSTFSPSSYLELFAFTVFIFLYFAFSSYITLIISLSPLFFCNNLIASFSMFPLSIFILPPSCLSFLYPHSSLTRAGLTYFSSISAFNSFTAPLSTFPSAIFYHLPSSSVFSFFSLSLHTRLELFNRQLCFLLSNFFDILSTLP